MRLHVLSALLILASVGCKEGAVEEAAQPAAAASPVAAAPAGETVAPPTPPPAAKPALPALGPAPSGMDPAKAAGCDKGDGAACFAAAQSIEPKDGWRAEMKPADADALAANVARYAQRGCDLGVGDSCAMAAHYFKFHSEEQFAALERGCELGALGACGDRGWSLLTTGNSRDNKKRGLELMEKACRGNAVLYSNPDPGFLCDQAAMFFRSTDKPIRDLAKAKELKALSCKQGLKLECPCKVDEDCGGGDYYCLDDKCTLPSAD